MLTVQKEKWIILKWWKTVPESKQRANSTVYSSMEEAEKSLQQLVKLMPTREFEIRKI